MAYLDTFATLGQARLDILDRIQSAEDYDKLWVDPKNATEPIWGDCWKACVEYAVPNVPAEVGFYINVLGFAVNAKWDNRVMLISSDRAYSFTLYEDENATPAQWLNMQFMVHNIEAMERAMHANGIPITQALSKPWGAESSMQQMAVETPNGISLTIWGMTG